MKRITVGANDKEQRLDKFLQKLLPDAPQSVIYKSLRKKRIKCNSKRVTDGATRLQEGDGIPDVFFITIICSSS